MAHNELFVLYLTKSFPLRNGSQEEFLCADAHNEFSFVLQLTIRHLCVVAHNKLLLEL